MTWLAVGAALSLVLLLLSSILLSRRSSRRLADKSTHSEYEAELRRLREENEVLRFSSRKFGELADRLSQRVRELERILAEYRLHDKR